MKFVEKTQPDGDLYVTTEGELWGHGIATNAINWANLTESEKEALYNKEFKKQIGQLYKNKNSNFSWWL